MAARRLTESQMTSVSDMFREFIPREKGESLEEQLYPWGFDGIRKRMEQPLTAPETDPMTISSILMMQAVEMQHWHDYLSFSTAVTDNALKRVLASVAWAEHLHHLRLQSLLPTPNYPAAAVLMSELALMINYVMCIDTEPSDSVFDAFQTIFKDHLMHAEYAASVSTGLGVDIVVVSGGVDLSGGTDIDHQFMKPQDAMNKFGGPIAKSDADPQTLLNIDQSLAGELAAWTGYQGASVFEKSMDVKEHYAAFSSVENQHVTILGSMVDPSTTILERLLIHEQVEMQNYSKLMEQTPNPQVKDVFQELYREDLEHARLFGEFV